MKKYFKLAVFLAATALFTSCQDEIGNDIDPPSGSDSNYLDKVYHIYSNGSVSDTFITQSYHYDGSKRVTNIDLAGSVSALFPTYTYAKLEKWNFQYNGSETLPSATQYILHNDAPSSSSRDTTNTYHFFNTAGKKMRDSAIYNLHSNTAGSGEYYEISKFISAYNYTGSTIAIRHDIVTKHLVPSQPDDIFAVNDTIITDSRGNSIAYKQYLPGFADPFIDEFYEYELSPSPMAKLNINKALSYTAVDTTIYPVTQTYNNRRKTTWRNPGSADQSQDYTGKYVLNAAGYPEQINVGQPQPGITHRIVFIYRNL